MATIFTKTRILLLLFIAFSATILRGQADCVISNEQTISVVSDPRIVLNGALTLCSGGTATLTATVQEGAGACEIHWQSSLNGTLWFDIVGERALTYTTPDLIQSTYYRALRICDVAGCDTATSNMQFIRVVQDPQITTNPVSFSECLGGNIPFLVTAIGGTPQLLYQWQISTDSLLFADIAGANSFSFIPNSMAIGTRFYRVIVSATGNGCGTDTSKIVKAIIVDDPIVTLISNDYFICKSDSIKLFGAVAGGTGTAVYQWQSGIGNGIWTNIVGAGSIDYPAPPLSITTYFRLVVTQGSGCETTSDSLKIQVDNCNSSIGNYVWVDCQEDGIQQGTERPLANVPVKLRGVQLDGLVVSKDTFTDALGFYSFPNLSSGRYVVIFSNPLTPTGIVLSAKNQGSDPSLDSNADPLTGMTDSITLASGENNLTIDVGFKDTTRPVVIAARDTSVQCDGAGNLADLNNWLSLHGFSTATDNYSPTMTWTNNFSTLSDSCGKTGSAYITFAVTDECGNRNTTNAKFTIIDTIPPSVIAAKDTIIDCDGLGNTAAVNAWLNNHGGGTASDVCSGDVVWTHDYAALNEPICGNSASALVTFTAKDSCGNATTTKARITVQ
ncbi:MAG: SdrD B-like domain-containing protein, partial [Saprospiraceae bacterium]|nr:SdrD B-like domain-containing protein [Saprospiraceae bacterium]